MLGTPGEGPALQSSRCHSARPGSPRPLLHTQTVCGGGSFVPTLQKGTSATKPVSSPQPWTPLLPQDQGQGPWVLRLRDPTSGGAAWHPQPPAAAGHGAPALLLQLHRATELSLGSLPGGVTASSRPVPGQAGSVRLLGNDSEWGGCWGPWSPGLPRGGQGVHAHVSHTVHVCMRVRARVHARAHACTRPHAALAHRLHLEPSLLPGVKKLRPAPPP